MLKKVLFAIAPMVLMVSTLSANDDLLSFDTASISDATIEIENVNLDDLDVDQLADQAGEDSDDAIEACFRRFGYGYRGGYGHYYNCYRPCYSYYYPSYYCYRPAYHYYTYRVVPVLRHYWGCY